MLNLGVIGGSGLYRIKGLKVKGKKKIRTPFGKPSADYLVGQIENTGVFFLPRHGTLHNLPPHKINYRANIWGFKKLGIKKIISVNAVGGIKKGLKPGDIVLLDQIIDMTKNRKTTFYDGVSGVVHIDFTHPFCPEMRQIIRRAGKAARVPLKNRGTYVAVEGPRLETAAEIRAFGKLGCDVVGMTVMPEALLARELEICYTGIAVVANYAAGIHKQKLTTTEVMHEMAASTEKIKRLLKETYTLLPERRNCMCKDALKDARI
jgi:5'-methylthioadenosine phosphorylase